MNTKESKDETIADLIRLNGELWNKLADCRQRQFNPTTELPVQEGSSITLDFKLPESIPPVPLRYDTDFDGAWLKPGALIPDTPRTHGAIWAELIRLRETLVRLGSNEAFDLPTSFVSRELSMRMDFARDVLESTPNGPTYMEEHGRL